MLPVTKTTFGMVLRGEGTDALKAVQEANTTGAIYIAVEGVRPVEGTRKPQLRSIAVQHLAQVGCIFIKLGSRVELQKMYTALGPRLRRHITRSRAARKPRALSAETVQQKWAEPERPPLVRV